MRHAEQLRVLFVGHTGILGGAERLLLDILRHLPAHIEPHVACPPGDVQARLEALGVPYTPLRGTAVSFKLRPRTTVEGARDLLASTRQLRRLISELQPDVVHANSVRAALIGLAATSSGSPPVLAHVHDCLPRSATGRVVRSVLTSRARTVLCVSNYVASCLGRSWGADVRTLRNGIDLEAFRPELINKERARSAVGIDSRTRYLIGVVGQITPWKAQDDAIRMLALVRERLPQVGLLLVGEPKFLGPSVRYDNAAFAGKLHELATELGVHSEVHFLGERDDVPTVLRALDLLIVPSWEDPFALVVLEAMAMSVPVLATSVGGPAEVIEAGRTGLLLPPRNPHIWADAIVRLLDDPDARARLAESAQSDVRSFRSMSDYAQQLVEIYEDTVTRLVAHPPALSPPC